MTMFCRYFSRSGVGMQCQTLHSPATLQRLQETPILSGVWKRLIIRSTGFAYKDVGKEREHDCMDAGGRATQGAVAEERKLCLSTSRACTPLFRLKLATLWI